MSMELVDNMLTSYLLNKIFKGDKYEKNKFIKKYNSNINCCCFANNVNY